MLVIKLDVTMEIYVLPVVCSHYKDGFMVYGVSIF